MKNIIIFTVILFIGEATQAQSNLIDNTYWIEYLFDTRDQSIQSKNQQFLQGDTLLNELTYKKLFIGDHNYYGCIRENENKFYAELVFYEPQELGEILLYDFSVSVGDTIISNTTEGILSHSPIITEIDTIELENNEKRKLFFLNGGEDIWIEGIGSIYGLLFPAFSYVTNYTTTHLVCFKQNEVVYYRDDALCLNDCCSLSTNIQPIRNQKMNVRCYPNPTSGKVIIKLPDGIDNKALILTDITGKKKWEKKKFSDNSFELDLSYFDNGIYTLTIKGKNYVTSHIIIKY